MPPATDSAAPLSNRAPTAESPDTSSVTGPSTTPLNDAPPVTVTVAATADELTIVPEPSSLSTVTEQPFRSSVASAATRSVVPADRCPPRSTSSCTAWPSHFSDR